MFIARLTLFALIFVVAFSSSSRAFTFSGHSRTYLQSRETVTGDDLTPLYEYLDFKTEGSETGAISFHFAGWARTDLTGRTGGTKTNNELQYAYISYQSKKNNALLNAGRLYVFEGVASEQIDGLYARSDLRYGFGLSAYGGSPVETDLDGRGGDSIYGGRVTHQVAGRYIIGLSYLKEENDSAEFREEEGIDLWWRAAAKFEIQGRSWYNAVTSGWMQHNYYLLFGPFSKLKVNVEASQINYEDYFHTTTLSAFQTPSLDPNETVQILGGALEYPFTPALSGIIDYKNYDYDIAGGADYYGGRLAYAVSAYTAGFSIYRMDGSTDRLKYGEYRGYARKTWGKTDATIDLLLVSYDEPINGVENAYTAVGAVGYDFSRRARGVADLEYGRNPDFDNEVKAFVRLVYRFGALTR